MRNNIFNFIDNVIDKNNKENKEKEKKLMMPTKLWITFSIFRKIKMIYEIKKEQNSYMI